MQKWPEKEVTWLRNFLEEDGMKDRGFRFPRGSPVLKLTIRERRKNMTIEIEKIKFEVKTKIKVPDAYLPLLEDLRLLRSDEQNPNVTTIRQQEQIWSSLRKYGWAYPIITNKDGVYADGEQRAQACFCRMVSFLLQS